MSENKMPCPQCGKRETTKVSDETYPGLYYCGTCNIDIRECSKCSNGTLVRPIGPSIQTMTCNMCGNRTDKLGVSIGGGGSGSVGSAIGKIFFGFIGFIVGGIVGSFFGGVGMFIGGIIGIIVGAGYGGGVGR